MKMTKVEKVGKDKNKPCRMWSKSSFGSKTPTPSKTVRKVK